MIKKLLLIIHLFLISAVEGKAQFELELFSFEEEVMNISASKNHKLDINGDPTALLKIVIPRLKGIVVESPVLISQEVNDAGETLAYLGDRTIKVTVKHPDFLPFVYKFEQPLQAKHVYTLTLTVPQSYYLPNERKGNKTLEEEIQLKEADKLREEGQHEKALSIYQKISDNAVARFHIGNYHYSKKNYKKALTWFTKSAEQGYIPAQSSLGSMYLKGTGVKKDYSKSIDWFRRAAEQGDAFSQNRLGIAYMHGLGVVVDRYEAAKWFRLSAEQGDVEAQFNMALTYYEGNGVPKDYSEAVKWYSKAGEKGHRGAQFNLALMYENGEGVKKDDTKAFNWYHKAAEQGLTFAQNKIGSMYQSGKGVAADFNLAVKWYTKAAESGLSDAQYNLGQLYETDHRLGFNEVEALKWYTKAAEQGIPEAQYRCGYLLSYCHIEGVPRDIEQGTYWFGQAAEQGHALSQYHIGAALALGKGRQKDSKKAMVWFVKAADQGVGNAKHLLNIFHQKGYSELIEYLERHDQSVEEIDLRMRQEQKTK